MFARAFPSCPVLPPLLVSLYLYLSDAQGNWFIFQYGSRSNMGWEGKGQEDNVICVNICQAFSLIFGSFPRFPFPISMFPISTSSTRVVCVFFFPTPSSLSASSPASACMINSLRNRRMPRKFRHSECFTCFAFRFLLCKQANRFRFCSEFGSQLMEIFYINLAHYKQSPAGVERERKRGAGEVSLGHSTARYDRLSACLSFSYEVLCICTLTRLNDRVRMTWQKFEGGKTPSNVLARTLPPTDRQRYLVGNRFP